ncbi:MULTISPECIES: hypothetical protein [Streptomyces]|nr:MULTISPECIES: hypothetical protein [Streptomyces]MDN5384926.1 hypothetical protein [Streptomyces sp. LB8]
MRTKVAVAAGSVVLSGFLAVSSSVAGLPGDVPGAVSGVLTPEEEAAVRAEVDTAEKADMYCKGKKVDPASGWSGAKICAEVSEDGTMQC